MEGDGPKEHKSGPHQVIREEGGMTREAAQRRNSASCGYWSNGPDDAIMVCGDSKVANCQLLLLLLRKLGIELCLSYIIFSVMPTRKV
jgi:hypothetical protein